MSAAVLLLIAYLGLTAIWAGLGLLVTGPLADSWVGTVDQDVAGWLVAHRAPVLDDWSRLGTMPADTRVKIIATAIIAVVMLIAWRSWREPLLVCLALILEAAVFITVTGIVGRPRPDVAQLDQVSVDTSFPSGHAAAAAAYCAIAIVIFERTRNRWLRTITVLVAVGVPVIVGASAGCTAACITSPTSSPASRSVWRAWSPSTPSSDAASSDQGRSATVRHPGQSPRPDPR